MSQTPKTSPYLLHVNSRPVHVSEPLWSLWYTTEHLPDLVNTATSARATFYREVSLPRGPSQPKPSPPEHPRKWLALYQTEYEECLKTKNYVEGVRHESGLFAREGVESRLNSENGDFDARNYSLVQVFDPKEVGEKPSPQILVVYMTPPSAQTEDFDDWYRSEHLDLLSKMPGYRRSLRYKIGPATPLTRGEPPTYLAIHEVEDVQRAFGSEEAERANETEWTKRVIEGCGGLEARAFELVHAEGY